MVPEDIRDFFVAGGSAAGALIGLLFVAISVSMDRLQQAKGSAQLHRVRASAALTAFTNALAVSLLALVPGHKLGVTSVVVAVAGALFVIASLLSLVRVRQIHWAAARDAVFLAGLCAVFVVQFVDGVDLILHPGQSGDVNTIAILVVVCFLIGIARAWELIGAPSIGIRHEITAFVRDRAHDGNQAQGPGGGSRASGDEAPP